MNGAEERSFVGRIEPGDDADDKGEAKADHDGIGHDYGGVLRGGGVNEELDEAVANADADDAADQCEHEGLDQDLGEDVAASGTDGAADADLANAFGDAGEHDIGDAETANEESNAGNESTTEARGADAALDAFKPVFARVEAEVTDAPVGEHENVAHLVDCGIELVDVGDADDDAADFGIGSLVDAVDHGAGLEEILHGGQRDERRAVFPPEGVIAGTVLFIIAAGLAAGFLFLGDAEGSLALGGVGEIRGKDANDGEGLAVEEDILTDGVGVFIVPEIGDKGAAKHHDTIALGEIHLGDEAAVFDFVFVSDAVVGFDANQSRIGLEIEVGELAAVIDLGRDGFKQGGGTAQGDRIGVGAAGAEFGDVFLIGRYWRIANFHALDTADLIHERTRASGDAFGEGKHGHERADAEDDAGHGEHGAEFMRPDFLDAFFNAEERMHEVKKSKQRRRLRAGGWVGLTAKAHVVGVGAIDELAVAQLNAARRLCRDVGIVRDERDGVARAVELAEKLQDRLASLRVERAGRFVSKDDLRLVDEGAGDGDALGLTTGKLARSVLQTVAESDGFNGAQGAFAAFLAADVGVDHRQLYVLENVEPRQQVERLENETDLLVADAGELVVACLTDIDAVEHDGAGADVVEATEDLHHGRFTTAGGTDDGDVLTGVDVERDTIERADFLVTYGVRLAHIAHFNQGHDRQER